MRISRMPSHITPTRHLRCAGLQARALELRVLCSRSYIIVRADMCRCCCMQPNLHDYQQDVCNCSCSCCSGHCQSLSWHSCVARSVCLHAHLRQPRWAVHLIRAWCCWYVAETVASCRAAATSLLLATANHSTSSQCCHHHPQHPAQTFWRQAAATSPPSKSSMADCMLVKGET